MSEYQNDEIDLIELLETVWDGKWLVAGLTGVAAIIGVVGALLLPPSFEGSVRLSALNSSQMADFATLNNTPGISAPVYADTNIADQKGVILRQTGVVLSEDLFASMLKELASGQIMGATHAKLDPGLIEFDGSAEEKREAMARIGKQYSFTFDTRSNTAGELTFPTADKQLARQILSAGLAALNNKIRKENLKAVNALETSIRTQIAFETEAVELQIQNALEDYEIKIAARIALLKEQAAIARQLDIADSQIGVTEARPDPVGMNVVFEMPLYLRGYKALEKELQLVKRRGEGLDVLPYIENYPELNAELRKLKSDMRVKRIEAGLNASPLIDENAFQAAAIDLDSLSFKATTNKKLIVILATLIGGIIAVVFVLIRSALKSRSART